MSQTGPAQYDLGEWDNPPGKLALLFDLPRVHAVLRDGNDPFDPGRDRPLFDAHLRCRIAAPDADAAPDGGRSPMTARVRRRRRCLASGLSRF